MGHLQGFLNAAWMPNPLSQFNRVQMKIAKVNKGLLYVRLPCLSRVICGFFRRRRFTTASLPRSKEKTAGKNGGAAASAPS
jgi:hypothetical protein